jgi:uncharacterized protein (UPF0335 family)
MSDLQTEAVKLKQFIDRIERLEGEKKEISEEISGIYKDMNQDGFSVQALKSIIRSRKQDERKRKEMEEIVLHYEALLEKIYKDS